MAYRTLSPLTRRRIQWTLLCLLFPVCLLLHGAAAPAQVWMQKLVPAIQVQAATPMSPYMDWMLDPGGRLTVEEVAQPERQAEFRPLILEKLPRETGTCWLRFTLAPRPLEARPSTLLLDLGEGVPSVPTLYAPKRTMTPGVTEWQEFTPSQRAVFLMPDAQSTPVTAYLKIEGLPGLWFAPMLRTPHNAATALERLARPAVIVALAVVMLLCLLRGVTERGQWRIWTAAYTGMALLHAIWGAPATPHGHVSMTDMAAVLTPGVALMLLPHVGRHLMRTQQQAHIFDAQYLLLTLPGAVLALLPLIPGFSWVCRMLDLWPLGTLLLVPTTIGAWLTGLPGARRFLLGCLLPAAGAGLALMGTDLPVPAPWLATAPLWGLALGALIITGTATVRDSEEGGRETEEERKKGSHSHEQSALQIVLQENTAMPSPQSATAQPAASDPRDAGDGCFQQALEKRLRTPLDILLREGTALETCSLPPAARQHAASLLNAARAMAVALADPTPPELQEPTAENGPCPFDLQQLLRDAHDTVAADAEQKNIALSWFMPPHLRQRYTGDKTRLADVLRLLLESAVRATSKGAVQLSVRRTPESVDPGHLLFTVTDTGSGVPPEERSSLALARAWELAGASRGFLGVESNTQGTSISFTIHLDMLDSETETEVEVSSSTAPKQPAGVLIVDENPGNRQLLVFFLEGLPYPIREARNAPEAVELFTADSTGLLLVDGDAVAERTLAAVTRIREIERSRGLAPTPILALTEDDSTWDTLHEAGFTHALTKPVTRSGLRKTVLELLPATEEGTASETLREENSLGEMPPLTLGAQSADREEERIVDTGMPLPVEISPVAPPYAAASPISIPAGDAPAPLTDHSESDGMEETSAPLRMTPERNDVPVEPHDAVKMDSRAATMPDLTIEPAAVPASPHNDALLEWVGEPVPVPRNAAMPQPAAVTSPRVSQGEGLLEWVGEPQPIIKTPSPEHAMATQPLPQAQGSAGKQGNAFVPLSMNPAQEPSPAQQPDATLTLLTDPLPPQSLHMPVTAPASPRSATGECPPVAPAAPQSAPTPVPSPTPTAATEKVAAVIPPIAGLLADLDAAMCAARTAFTQSDLASVQISAGRIAAQTDGCGLRVLARMARCVEGAARAGDKDALVHLLPELETAVERNRIALAPRK